MRRKHTPGPWIFDALLKLDGTFGGSYIVSNDADRTWPISEVYREDNARLIAAAPELLEALQLADTILQGMGPLYPHGDGAKVIRAAIAKAKGE